MDRPFVGRDVIVTGASSGIGRAIAVELANCGANLWLTGRSETELEVTAAMVRDEGSEGSCHCVPMDVSEAGALAGLVKRVAQETEWLFGLVNNAGLMYPEPVMRGTRARWEAMFAVNVLAPLEGCQAAITAMRAQARPGHLINIGSVAGRWEVGGVYGASKVALEMIGRSLREELEQDDIRIATIIPGGFKTNLSRGFKEEEIATIARNAQAKGVSDQIDRRVADPKYLAQLVRFIMALPIDVNIEDVTMRPPINIKV